ncbi:DUF6786 family protein [Chitinophaga sp. NPDC101104]|uniref:DUF6786 family protein n=1 Tax=Chitinophaga sp. NPDC101104 TaxID=3390561 RepID=UPI003CFEC340
MKPLLMACLLTAGIAGCQTSGNKQPNKPANFGEDVAFLRQHLKNVVVLQLPGDSSRVLVTGDYQARVMTSSASGDAGNSFGWINYDLIGSGKLMPHINAFGGEERFWLGPEGGQYALFFPPGKPYEFTHWQTPGMIDTAHYNVTAEAPGEVSYQYAGAIQNHAGYTFKLGVARTIRLLGKKTIESKLGIALPEGLRSVAYETENQVSNLGDSAWQETTGLPSIWLLGMFKPSEQTAVVAPFRPGADSRKLITDDYFGKIPARNLQVNDSLLLFRADGKARGKLGIAPGIAKTGAGSIDLANNSITVLLYEISPNGKYVNSKWEDQAEPYKGDAVNCYNDGPLEDGTQMGPFYEVESSSDVIPLQPGEARKYSQVTMHFEGDAEALKALAEKLWQLPLDSVRQFLQQK